MKRSCRSSPQNRKVKTDIKRPDLWKTHKPGFLGVKIQEVDIFISASFPQTVIRINSTRSHCRSKQDDFP